MPERLKIGAGDSTLELRDDFVLVTELADVQSVEDMQRWLAAIDRFALMNRVDRAVFDGRQDGSDTTREIREARWAHTDAAPVLKHIAVVISSPMAVTRLNMTALARKSGAKLRAFNDLDAAIRWISRR